MEKLVIIVLLIILLIVVLPANSLIATKGNGSFVNQDMIKADLIFLV